MRFLLSLVLLAAPWLSAQDPVDFAGWMKRGIEEFKDVRYPEAVAAFHRAIAADPNNVEAHLYLGTAYMVEYIPGGDGPFTQLPAKGAMREFQRVLDLDPKNARAMAAIANLRLTQRSWDEAQQWFDKLIALEPANADAHYCLGYIAWSKWYPAYGQARAELEMSQEQPGPIPDGFVRADLAGRFGGLLDDGIRALSRALEIDPNYTDAMAYMNLLLRERADLRDTAEEYRRDIATADQWVERALAARKIRAEQAPEISEPLPTIGMLPPPSPPAPPPARSRHPHPDMQVSTEVAQRFLVRNVEPVYPPLARQARIEGTVHIRIIIDFHGTVVYAKAIGGHHLLIPSALEAVKQWEYNPAMFNPAARYAATQASITYSLGH